MQFPFTQITIACEFLRGALSRWKEEETMPNCWHIKEVSRTVWKMLQNLLWGTKTIKQNPNHSHSAKFPTPRNSTIAPLHFYKKLSPSTCLVCTSPFEDHDNMEDSLICLFVCTFHTFPLLFHYCIIDDSPCHLELIIKLTDGIIESANTVNHVSFSLS